jgi:hypothetical protein
MSYKNQNQSVLEIELPSLTDVQKIEIAGLINRGQVANAIETVIDYTGVSLDCAKHYVWTQLGT